MQVIRVQIIKAPAARAALLAGGMIAIVFSAGCATQPARTPVASVPACTASGVQAIQRHITLSAVPAACRGLSRAELNFALGRALYQVAGSGRDKVGWRKAALAASRWLAPLVKSPAFPAAPPPIPQPAGPGAADQMPADHQIFGLLALISWLLAVGSGGYMLGRWLVRGGLRQQRATGEGLAPGVLFGHFGLATVGLLVWISYLASQWTPLAWLAVGLLLPVFGLGIATLTLWVPYAAARRGAVSGGAVSGGAVSGGAASGGAVSTGASPGESASPAVPAPPAEPVAAAVAAGPASTSDAVLARALTDDALARSLVDDMLAQVPGTPPGPARRPGGHFAALVPAGHGIAAMGAILFALLTAIGR